MARRLEGNAGAAPQSGSPAERPAENLAPGRTAVLRVEGDRAFVEVDGERIWLDAPATILALGRAPFARVPVRKQKDVPQGLSGAIDAANVNRAKLEAILGVVAVRAGYHFDQDGRITTIPAVVVAVTDDFVRASLPQIGFTVDVTPADPYDLLRSARGGFEAAAAAMLPSSDLLIEALQRPAQEALEMARVITYQPPADASLPEVTAPMTIVCHVSPDAGWRVLRRFLSDTREEFVLGMYDFTAPHIYTTVRSLLKDSDVTWKMTLGPHESLPGEDEVDSTKADDKTEDSVVLGLRRAGSARFSNAFAHIGSGQTFASAYHIKVGVRDRSSFWLSSGNWQSSNQPDIDFLDENVDRQLIAKYNREWHVVVESEQLARIFETYLKGDFDTASRAVESAAVEAAAVLPDLLVPEAELFAEERGREGLQVFAPKKFTFGSANPVRVQPILTPDNYIRVVTGLLRDAHNARTLYFQNQSLNPVKQPTEEFDELMQLLAEYSHKRGLDIRMIFRNIGPVRKKLESLQAAGFNMDCIKMQSGCHTKGIIIDSKVVLLGSHNFTNDGVQFNRDASLLIFDEGIASYYQDVFLHDWERLARPTIRSEAAPLLAGGQEAERRGYVRVPWSFYDDES